MDKSKIKSLLIKAISNKFSISLLVFFFWLFFFDQHSIWERKEYKSKIEALSEEKEHFLTRIKKDKASIHELKTNRENLEKFAADPEAYAPQYGGYCAFAVSHNFTKPVNPNKWKIVDGKLYLNLNGTAYRKWQADQDAAIKRGNSNWPTALKTCEKHDNCQS